MTFNKKAEREFVNDLDSFSEKKRPSFEVGKNKSFLSKYTSAADADIYSANFLKKEIPKSDDTKAPVAEKPEKTFKRQMQGAAAIEKSVKQERSVNSQYLAKQEHPVSRKTGKEIISSYTDVGGGVFFKAERQENGKFQGSKEQLDRFKEHTDKGVGGRMVEAVKPEENEAAASIVDDKAILATILREKFKDEKKRFSEIRTENKQGFKNKTAHFMDAGGRFVEAVKPEENEAAASNVDDKAILATIILREKFKDEKKRLSKIHTEKKEETKRLLEDIRKEQQEILTHGKFSESIAEFTDKGKRFSDKYLNAFNDKKVNVFSEEYVASGSNVVNELNKHDAAAVAIQQKMERELSGFSNETSFDKKNELSGRKDEVKASSAESGVQLEDKFSETTVKAADNKNKKSVNSYFSKESDAAGNHQKDRMTNQEKLDLSKSEQKFVKKEENKAVRKAASIAAVSNMLRVKKEIQNAVGDMNPAGDLIKDGSAGMLRAAVNGIKSAVVNQIRGLLIKVLSAVMAGLMHIVVLAAPLIVVVVIVVAIMTTFLSVFTDSSNIPDGDGYVYSSLAGTEIDDIIADLYLNFPAEMNSMSEALLRYALSKVGCAYDQNQHWNLTVDIFDCSSLAYRAYRGVGVDISNGGVYSAAEICREAVESGFIAYGDLLPGDLVFYGGRNNGRYLGVYHVAIYVGNGKMVEARGRSSGVVYCDVRTDNIVGYSRYI